MMGQSNMLGEGKKTGPGNTTLESAVQTQKKYPYLWDASTGNYSVRHHTPVLLRCHKPTCLPTCLRALRQPTNTPIYPPVYPPVYAR